MRAIILIFTHAGMLGVGFALGIYLLPILTAPKGPDAAELAAMAQKAVFTTEFTRDLEDSDFLHWGEGTVSLTPTEIVHQGALSPGPDYKLYLLPEYVETEAGFEAIKDSALQLGDIKTFDGFILPVPEGTDLTAYTTVLIWCEAFGEFITAGQYR